MRLYSGFKQVRQTNLSSIHNETVAVFENFPVYMGCVESPKELDVHENMYWIKENDTVVVKPIIDSSLVYLANHNEVVGETWLAHHRQFADFVLKNMKGNSVYEIGGAHGLLSIFVNKKKTVKWTLHDINPTPNLGFEGEIISGKFKANSDIKNKTSTIVHSHTLEHVNNPIQFMNMISSSQNIGDLQIFSVPNMDAMIARGDLNFLNFEHNYFLSRGKIFKLLNENGYQVIDEFKFRDHSIFYATIKKYRVKYDTNYEIDYSESNLKETFDRYFEINEKRVLFLNNSISLFDGDVYIFGAHIFTQMLISMGLATEKVIGCLDNSKGKERKRLYGTELKTFFPETALINGRKQLVVGSIATYASEVRNQIKKINPQAEVLI